MALKKANWHEALIYLALWAFLFIAPVMSMSLRSSGNGIVFDWSELFSVWKHYALFLVIFLIHNFLLAPLLIFKQRRALYFGACLAVIVLFQVYECTHRPQFKGHGPRHEFAERPRHFADNEAHEFGERPPLPPDMENLPDKRHGNKPHHPPLMFGEHDLVALIVLILMLGMNLGVKLYFKQREDREKLSQLAKQNLEQQLEYLKYQINPHFFMNTLNNIHALVDIDPEKAKTTILELSKLMRFVLYEGNKPRVPLDREIAFVQNYITLMKIRYTDKVRITFLTPDTLPSKEVPPLIFITFVENAFKHGVTYQQESFIQVEFRMEQSDQLTFICRNSRIEREENSGKEGGVGLTNVRQRLELIYGNRFTLDIKDDNNQYLVNLTIPL